MFHVNRNLQIHLQSQKPRKTVATLNHFIFTIKKAERSNSPEGYNAGAGGPQEDDRSPWVDGKFPTSTSILYSTLSSLSSTLYFNLNVVPDLKEIIAMI